MWNYILEEYYILEETVFVLLISYFLFLLICLFWLFLKQHLLIILSLHLNQKKLREKTPADFLRQDHNTYGADPITEYWPNPVCFCLNVLLLLHLQDSLWFGQEKCYYHNVQFSLSIYPFSTWYLYQLPFLFSKLTSSRKLCFSFFSPHN